MCGIIAAVLHDALRARHADGLAALTHRGPDAQGEWSSGDGGVWLGHRRLSIVDLSAAGNQPMSNEDRSVHLVCNGEIYNAPALRSRLEGLGHVFSSRSDSETILHAYESWGEDCVERLEGMFAFALWDETRRVLLAARDRVGIKPLYYAEYDGGLLLASEAGALLPFLPGSPSVDPLSLAYMLTLGYVPSPRCIWEGLRKLEPGEMVRWTPGQGCTRRVYWEPPRHVQKDDGASSGRWPELFETVLEDHLLADVPLGLFLSSGLDSSSVAVGLKGLGRSVQALTISFPGMARNEAEGAAFMAEYLGFPHREIPLVCQNVGRLAAETMAAFDEPQGFGALLTMFLVSRAASAEFKVVLAGDGGDEVFGGYSWHRDLEGGLRRFTLWPFRPKVRQGDSPEALSKAMRAFSRMSPLHRHAWRVFPRFLPEEVAMLLSPLGVRFDDRTMLAPLRRHFEPKLPLRRALQRVDLMTFCADSILAKVDRASMRHALEVRVPYLDRRVVEWGLSLPCAPEEDRVGKRVVREYLAGRVPEEVLNRPKQGFSLPLLQDFDWDAALGTIRAGKWVSDGMWHKDWERMVAQGTPLREGRIWALYLLTLWGDAWLA